MSSEIHVKEALGQSMDMSASPPSRQPRRLCRLVSAGTGFPRQPKRRRSLHAASSGPGRTALSGGLVG